MSRDNCKYYWEGNCVRGERMAKCSGCLETEPGEAKQCEGCGRTIDPRYAHECRSLPEQLAAEQAIKADLLEACRRLMMLADHNANCAIYGPVNECSCGCTTELQQGAAAIAKATNTKGQTDAGT